MSHGLNRIMCLFGVIPLVDLLSFVLLLFVGMDDTVRMLEDASEVVITGEITAVNPPPRPAIEADSSVGVGGLSSEVADFLKEFDAKAPNPHPE